MSKHVNVQVRIKLFITLYCFSFDVFNSSIFVAFILEAFILEYSIQKTGRLESEVESKIKELGLGIGQYALFSYLLSI